MIKTVLILKNKKILQFLAVAMIIVLLILTVSCNSSEESSPTSMGDLLLDLGYKNCLVCHVDGKIPLARHCDVAMAQYEGIAVTVYYCTECHLDMRTITDGIPKFKNCVCCHED
jgi:hypothetical protein